MLAEQTSAQTVAQLFFQVARRMQDFMSPEDLALSPVHLGVLDKIMSEPRTNGKEIAAHYSITPASASAILKRLETEGHIVRERADYDRRSFSWQVTEAGHNAMCATVQQMNVNLAPFFDTLTDHQRKELVGIFQKLIEQ